MTTLLHSTSGVRTAAGFSETCAALEDSTRAPRASHQRICKPYDENQARAMWHCVMWSSGKQNMLRFDGQAHLLSNSILPARGGHSPRQISVLGDLNLCGASRHAESTRNGTAFESGAPDQGRTSFSSAVVLEMRARAHARVEFQGRNTDATQASTTLSALTLHATRSKLMWW